MTREWRKEILVVLGLSALCALLFGFALGDAALLDPDEPFYSLTAKEMVERGDPSTPLLFGEPQFEKPILFYWVLYGFFQWLGVSEFAARLGPCLAGWLTVLATYALGRTLFRRRTALMGAVMLAASGQFIVLSRIVLTDIFLCLFTTATFLFFMLGYRQEKTRAVYWHLAFASSALAFLTKGPLGFFIPFAGIVSYLIAAGERTMLGKLPWLTGGLLFAVIGFPWYALMTERHGVGFLSHTFFHENVRRIFVAEHPRNDHPLFYSGVLLFGFFPWSAFLVPALVRGAKRAWRGGVAAKPFLLLSLSFVIPLIFFTTAKSKLMSYIFPLFPLAALFMGAWLDGFLRGMRMGLRPSWPLTLSVAAVWGVVPAALVVGGSLYARHLGLDLAAPVTAIASGILPLFWGALALFLLKKYTASLVSALAAVAVFTSLAFAWLLPAASSELSSKKWAERYGQIPQKAPSTFILTSKLFIRGVTFYTGARNIGVFSTKPRGGFYTPHPVKIISDSEQLSRLEKDEFPVYCLLRDKELRQLRETVKGRFTLSPVTGEGHRRWVRLDRV